MSLVIRRIIGDSMLPAFKEGQIVVAVKTKAYKTGQIVIARQNGRQVIKRISTASGQNYNLLGDNNKYSSDSRKYGSVLTSDILGRVVIKI